MNKLRLQALVARFLTWPVPADVYPDGTPGQPGRTGTNLLSAPQAEEMLRHVLAEESCGAMVTEQRLRDALMLWETAHRTGGTRTHAETSLLPLDQVVDESTAFLWRLLTAGQASTEG